MLTRRSVFLGLIAAPAVVRASSLMPIRAWLDAPSKWTSLNDIVNEVMRSRARTLAEDVTLNNALFQKLKERGEVIAYVRVDAFDYQGRYALGA